MPEFELVDRPNGGSDVDDEMMKAIVGTRDQPEKAIKVDLSEVNFTNWQSNVRNRLKKLNLKLRAKYDKPSKTAKVWVEPLEDEK